MSRVGKAPITIPQGVNVAVKDSVVEVSGSKGTLSHKLLPAIKVQQEGDTLALTRLSESQTARANHGLMRVLINNMVIGVSKGYERKLEIEGVGYRVNQQGQELNFSIGYSHPVKFKLPEGINATVEQNTITVSGSDKQKVGQVAAQIREIRKPEPYKGKGIKYQGERIIRKAGKSGKEQA